MSEAKRNEIFVHALGRSYLKEDTEGVSRSSPSLSSARSNPCRPSETDTSRSPCFHRSQRVIRLDTFSKTIAPGCRMGWTTSNALFTERLTRASETSTQQPSGAMQVLLINLLVKTWGMSGWLRWLRGIRGE